MQNNTQKKKTLTLSFIWMAWERFSTWRHRRIGNNRADDKSNAFRLYNDCNDLPLKNFIECICNDDLSQLVVDGECTSLRILQDKWLSVYSEFIQLSHETDILHLKMLRQNVLVLKARIAKIHTCVNAINLLGSTWDTQMENEEAKELMAVATESLRKLGYRYKYDPYGKTFYKDLNSVLGRCNEWEIQLELRESEIAAIEAKQTGEKLSPIYFTQNLIRMSQYWKYSPPLSASILSTAEYCIYKRDYIEQINQRNNAKHR